ncbi:hypothetical protein LCGC14_1527920 [marine sediment metagenome]|uniref:Uncharacterized protein n=1 Tax=marine sediment metagenome TaxID=412755 RepID=A0A0F9JHL9_9ZZZZ
MTKKKSVERGKVTLGVKDLSNETHMFLQRLDDVVSQCGDSMLITKLAEIVDAIKAECGEDAKVSVHIDDYFGNHVDITWYRPETDEEWAKRLEANKNKAAGQRKKRATDKKNKEIKERAELARLSKKYKA